MQLSLMLRTRVCSLGPSPQCKKAAGAQIPVSRVVQGRRRRRLRLAAVSQLAASPPTPPAQQAAATSATQRAPLVESGDDIVVVGACRTPSTRARKGGLKEVPADELVRVVLSDLLRRTGVKPEDVGDVCLGSVFPPSSKRANEVRSALLLAGFPVSVPAYTVNRQCAAGLQSIANVAAGIRAGFYDLAVAGGVETLTRDPLDWQGSDSPRILENQHAQDVKLPLGLTAENVAEAFGVPRHEQDYHAAQSHAKAAAAQAAGKFKDEIVPVDMTVKDPKTGEERQVRCEHDDGVRPECSADSLAALKPYFKKGGTVTVGNACQNTDCAAAVMLTSRREAQRRGLPIMATLRSFAAVGVPPAIMGTAPSKAIPKALERAGVSKEDIDVFELNEAFSSQFAYCMRELGLPEEKVNPSGGAIALGHPAGATGARQTVTLLHELKRRNGSVDGKPTPRFGVVSMCTGAGMGAAAVFSTESSGSSQDSTSSASAGSVGESGSVGSTASVATVDANA